MKGAADAFLIKNEIRDSWIVIEEIDTNDGVKEIAKSVGIEIGETAAIMLATQLWKPKKHPQPFDYPPNPEIPKTKSNPKPLSVDPSKHAQFCTYSALYV